MAIPLVFIKETAFTVAICNKTNTGELAYMEIRGISCALMLGWAAHTYGQSLDDDLSLSFGDEEFVSIATGQREHISKAPAVASVITAEDIRAMGAADINDVLETVPGLHVSVSSVSYNPIYIMRGIYSEFNPQVLFLINGIPITHLQVGDRGQYWGGMPVEGIARIEVLRGPGSAVYGADAYAGIVNIITKTHGDIDGLEVGFRSGSFDTADLWALYGGETGDWKYSSSFEFHSTKGFRENIESDTQTFFDSLFSTSASLAPGPVNVGAEAAEARFDLSNKNWKFRLGYQEREDVGTGAGIAQALDPEGSGNAQRLNFDANYENKSISEKWLYKIQLSYFDSEVDSENLILFPPGTVLPIGSDGNIATLGGGFVLFPDGVSGNPDLFEEHVRLNLDTYYSGLERHSIRFGIGFSNAQLEASETKNFGPGILDGSEGIVDGTLTDVTGTDFIFIRDQDRDIKYLFLQDEWMFSNDWKLTSGVRYDDYSDFGDTINPRLALVWQGAYNFTTKLLYGQAFRAPSFIEQFNINNPVVIGNPDLNPEEIDSIELVFDYTSDSGNIRTTVNLFNYEMKDVIRFIPDPAPATSLTAQNTTGQDGQGFEWEVRWDIGGNTRLSANYAFQDSEDKLMGSDVANAPGKQFFVRLDEAFSDSWKFQIQAKHVADRKRAIGDVRPPVDDYTRVDATLRYSSDTNEGIHIALISRNLFDEEIREPSLAPGLIIYDLPLAGRQMFAELRYHW